MLCNQSWLQTAGPRICRCLQRPAGSSEARSSPAPVLPSGHLFWWPTHGGSSASLPSLTLLTATLTATATTGSATLYAVTATIFYGGSCEGSSLIPYCNQPIRCGLARKATETRYTRLARRPRVHRCTTLAWRHTVRTNAAASVRSSSSSSCSECVCDRETSAAAPQNDQFTTHNLSTSI